MKTVLIILLFFLNCFFATIGAQNKSEIVDTTFYRITYRLNQQVIKNKEPFIITDTMALDIGRNWSMYYNLFRDYKDSLDIYYRSNKMPGEWRRFGGDEETLHSRLEAKREPVDILDERKFGESSKIYKNREKKEITTIDDGPLEMPDTYTLLRFIEEIPPQNWEIETDTLVVLNYLCQKATTSFRGRNYTAWFTVEIPVSEGPWKLYGLPGLILSAESEDGIFQFKAIALEKVRNKPIEIVLDKQNVLRGKPIKFKRKFIGSNLKQWQAYRKERFKTISIGFLEGNDVQYYKAKNPIEYIEMEIDDK